MCPECLGDGVVVVCVDDLCVGQGYCIHGDGEEPCPECGGEGYLPDDEDDWDYCDDRVRRA